MTHTPEDAREKLLPDGLIRTLAEGMWALARKRCDLRPEFMPDSRTDIIAKAEESIATRPTPTEAREELASELERIPVRTEILNVDTGKRGEQSVVVSLVLRDRVLSALRSAPSRSVEGEDDDTCTTCNGSGYDPYMERVCPCQPALSSAGPTEEEGK
jgi:hypothetical protein